MSKLGLSAIVKSVRTAMKKHSPEILTGIGIAGMITTAVMAVRATPKALILIAERESETEGVLPNLTPIEKVKAAWPCYIPAAITGGLSIACLIGASSVNVRRNAALATAYTLSETALKEYQEKVVEQIGEKKEQAVMDSIAKDQLNRNPISNTEVVITDKGNTLCFDSISGRYFRSDIDRLKKSINDLNKNLLDVGYVSLNDWYYELGLSNNKIGDDIGWNIDNGLIELRFSSQLAEDDTPCLVLNYALAPRYDYYK